MKIYPSNFFCSLRQALILLLFPALASGAPRIEPAAPGFRPVTLNYENSTGEKAITHYFYNDFGLMDRAHWELADGSRSSENYYTYNRAGHLVRKYREYSDGTVSDEHYTYDRKGRLIRETFERSDSVSGFADYAYDTKGRVKEADCRGLGGWFHGTIEYTTDTSGRKKFAVIKKDGAGIGNISYNYDNKGNLLKEYWDLNGRWTQTFLYTHEPVPENPKISCASVNPYLTYNSGFRVIGEDYVYAGGVGGPSTYEYNGQGRLIRKIFTRSDGLQSVTTYSYDKELFPVSSYREYSDGLSCKFTYEFNGNRKLLKKTFSRSDGLKGYETFEYDGMGRLKNAVYQNVDGWLNGTLAFAHSESGLIESGRFTGRDNFNADLQFGYDENNNLIRIHWIFSFGKTQTYDFEYGPAGEVIKDGTGHR